MRGHVDGVALHPYGNPAVVVDRVRGARAALVSLGMGAVPIYVTEFGWTTQPAGSVGYAPASRRPTDIGGVLDTPRPSAVRADRHAALHMGHAGAQPNRRPGLVRHRQPHRPEYENARHGRVRSGAARRGITGPRAAPAVRYLMQLVATAPLRLQPSSASTPVR